MMRRVGVGNAWISVRNSATEAAKESRPKLTIQNAINRKPTDLLSALSKTVGTDPTAPHFAFIDDPITIPSTAAAKKNYFMAKEMGKRAARELAQEWPTLFAFDRDQPRLPAFRPQQSPDPLQVEPTEENLMSMILKREVTDASMLYERMRSDNISVSELTMLELLKLLAYYNGSNVPFAEWDEWPGMRYFGLNEKEQWKNGGVADLLFETLPKTNETTSIMISGLCKFASPGSISKARELFKEVRKSGGTVTRSAYDSLISVSEFEAAKKLCGDMSKAGLRPSVATFNALLISASNISKHAEKVSKYSQIIGEMSNCGVRPVLSTYYHTAAHLVTLKAQYENPSNEHKAELEKQMKLAVTWVSEMLTDVENRLSSGEIIEVFSTNCCLFFSEAMKIAYGAANMDLARRILKAYESSQNKAKMPAFSVEAVFYNRYLQLFIEQSASIKDIDEIYKSFVPRLVGVSRQLSRLLFEKLRSKPHWPLLRRVIEDGISARQMTDLMLANDMRRLLIEVEYHALSVTERDEYAQLVQKMVAIWTEFSRFTEEYSKRLQQKLSPCLISECALLLTRIGEVEKAYEMLDLILDEEFAQGEEAVVTSQGHARPSAMAELFEDALRQKNAMRAATCLEIMSLHNTRSKLEPLAKRIEEKCNLTDSQKKIIQGFVRLRPQ